MTTMIICYFAILYYINNTCQVSLNTTGSILACKRSSILPTKQPWSFQQVVGKYISDTVILIMISISSLQRSIGTIQDSAKIDKIKHRLKLDTYLHSQPKTYSAINQKVKENLMEVENENSTFIFYPLFPRTVKMAMTAVQPFSQLGNSF